MTIAYKDIYDTCDKQVKSVYCVDTSNPGNLGFKPSLGYFGRQNTYCCHMFLFEDTLIALTYIKTQNELIDYMIARHGMKAARHCIPLDEFRARIFKLLSETNRETIAQYTAQTITCQC